MAALLPAVAQACGELRHPVIVQPLTLSLEALVRRRHEPGPEGEAFAAWLKEVGDSAAGIARELGLSVLPVADTTSIGVDEVVSLILGRITVGLKPGCSGCGPLGQPG